ncbi:hypothetical protein BACOVA_05024 [Bacteroides ovatus ATCC 8483]|uniref:Uncharacterized protein n=1 Tax=Bacteroides ovatus (strain ATCC 8483 / DSM 1896 / JCM 5824 / BCRC 10623 / CCUG 4943 / NCTC 11153) TaxID=411476 RepID=A0AAN3A347_BACO1|nr:hypothetical protein BACOVA_05024 [Bacteroides ovatus ATCC 8483]
MKMVNKCGGKLYLLLKMNVIYETIIDFIKSLRLK